MKYHTQCVLKKDNIFQITWIPSKYAKMNKKLKLKKETDNWDDGWEVVDVGRQEKTKVIIDQEYEHRTVREYIK